MLPLDRPKISDSAAYVGPGVFGDTIRKLSRLGKLKSTIGDCFYRSSNRVMNKGAHLARLLLCDEFQGVEVFDLAGKFDRKPLDVKLLDVVSATAAMHQRTLRVFDVVAHRCNEAKAGNHDTTCQVKAP